MAFSQGCFHTQRLEGLTECTEGQFRHAKETKPCGGPKDTDCHVGEWHEWTSCSAVCGKGRHTRMRCLVAGVGGWLQYDDAMGVFFLVLFQVYNMFYMFLHDVKSNFHLCMYTYNFLCVYTFTYV